ncbi:MAG: hypothetical protein GQE15_24230 [Archangiaceae bacterium]|nr:hypothetical protein [Archangiaceae bacterium]
MRVFVGAALAVAVLGGGVIFLGRSHVTVPATSTVTPLSTTAAELQAHARVILVTLDGARWQDVLDQPGALRNADEPPAMPKLLELIRTRGVALPATTSSALPLSLPGYQAITAGHRTRCDDNDCPRIDEETLAEGLGRRLHLPADQTATFASWARLANAASSRDGVVLVDAPPPGPPHAGGPPWDDARWDEETVTRALAHWRTSKPRFLHLALLDMDEQAHRKDAVATVKALRFADETIATLLAEVERLPEAERRLTTVLITTDHGRGPGRLWPSHTAYASSRDIFVVALGPLVTRAVLPASQADVRPMVERLFGLCSRAAVKAVVGDLPCALAPVDAM